MKRYIRSNYDLEDLEHAILHDDPFSAEEFEEYWDAYHEPNADAIQAKDVRKGDIIVNTECAEEMDINDIFLVESIDKPSGIWEDFDVTFNIKNLSKDEMDQDIHYMDDEYVGVVVDEPMQRAIASSCGTVKGAFSSLTKQSLDTSTLVDFLTYQYKGYDGDKGDLFDKLSSKYNKEVATAVCKKVAASTSVKKHR